MGCKLSVALRLEVAHHFIERLADGRTRRFEPPATLGATKTPKTLLVKPYQLPAHGRLCRCAPTSACLLSRDETFWFAINDSFRRAVLPDCTAENRHPNGRGGKCVKARAKSTCASLDGLSGILHTWKIVVYGTPDFGASFEVVESLKCRSRFVCLEAVSIAQRQGRIQRSVDRSSRGLDHALRDSYPSSAQRGRRVHPRMCEWFRC